VIIIYFAGFATAIYCLAPAGTKAATGQTEPKNQPMSFSPAVLNSNEFAQSFNSGMRTCLAAGSRAAVQTGEYIKQTFYSDKETAKTVARNK